MTATPVLMILAEVFVPGHPKTKGSMEHIGGGKLRESVTGSKKWRQLVASQIKGNCAPGCFCGRVGVWITSYLQCPAGQDPWAWIMGDKSGDTDKLARNVLDAIGCESKDDACLIANDAQVWNLMSSKRLAHAGMLPGQQIRVWAIPESEPW